MHGQIEIKLIIKFKNGISTARINNTKSDEISIKNGA